MYLKHLVQVNPQLSSLTGTEKLSPPFGCGPFRETICPTNYEIRLNLLDISFPKRHYNKSQEQFELAKFEECLDRLEKIVLELEKGEVPLEKSLTLFEEGMQLSASCRKELEEAEGKVEILLKQNGKLQTEPFEPPTEKTLRK